MLLLSKENMQSVFSMKDAISVMKKAFSIYSSGGSVIPLRTNINIEKHQGQSLIMTGYVEELDSAGVKIISVFPNNIKRGKASVTAKMLLIDGETGGVCCMMDGTYLTQLRTGAASGAATDILARKDAENMLLFGTGGQAASQLEAVLSVRSIKTVKVMDIDIDRARKFSERMQRELERYGADISVCEDIDSAVSKADVITAVTTTRKPVFDGRKVKQGVHVNGVGAYTPEMQELDEYLIVNADKVFVDSRDAVLSEAGDIITPLEKGLITIDRINGELGEVIAGKIQGRTEDTQITVFKTVGIAVEDLVAAHAIYKKALENGMGIDV